MNQTLVVSLTEKTITFVVGGVRSGKSRFAQTLATRHKRVLFIATARGSDDEMRAKIARHRDDRPAHWQTAEEPFDLDGTLRASAAGHDIVLIDCLTLWVSNVLPEAADERAARLDRFYEALRVLACPAVIVSNEVGSGIVPAYATGRVYRDLLGETNQRVAALAGTVVLMVAGIPLAIKGALEPSA